ncbi:MAG: radical SAM protein [Spirochaetaceae bacterium]|nr:radical SAM protein [Spirochaetaceae bacterium]
MRLSAGKRLKRRKLLRFDVHLTDHCNLNCKGCDNFSPIAPKCFLDKETFEKDCARLSELSGGKLEDICFLGGEPLLHPEITGIIKIARKYFPKTSISILTNGILLLKMNDEFWDCCRGNNIKITITKYPVKIDIAAIKEVSQKAEVTLSVLYEDGGRSFIYKPLNLSGKSNKKDSFTSCWHANRCIHLSNSRLSCTAVSYIEILNKAIIEVGGGGDKNQEFEVSENDYIDIYKAKSIDEILDFLAKPMPFCRYCDFSNISFGRKWAVSARKLSEWILE